MIGFLVVLAWFVPVLVHAAVRVRRILKLNYPISLRWPRSNGRASIGDTFSEPRSDTVYEIGAIWPIGKRTVWVRKWRMKGDDAIDAAGITFFGMKVYTIPHFQDDRILIVDPAKIKDFQPRYYPRSNKQ